ncbi:LAMI_0A07250g1_1 [Lachancea mirantina]|uniref:AP-1 complex subunit gamma n=1 Tax=Lachancea mirantina TaxID=1230905 RepID=A0A1G4IQT5_9SACH|nr:LAMI_0A07250g1_1 [Lachancea mirantina]
MGSLKTFIKEVRSAKTLAEEKSIITKESAKIRTKLKDDHLSLEKRRKNIQKLLYLYILGEKTHFAQVECINLISSDDFQNKRLGYLAAVLLLDEQQEILTLLTNLLNNDLNHPNSYIVSMALSALGSLTSPELARDLYPDVEQIINRSTEPLLVKKALQCAARLVTRDAALLEIFYPYCKKVLDNHRLCTHGVLLGVLKLCQSIIEARNLYEFDNYLEILASLIDSMPEFFSLLQNLNSAVFNQEFDVNGTSDPFLQVELLRTLRMLFACAPEKTMQYVDKFGDLLTQLASIGDGSKNSAHAVAYECVRTIFELQLDQSLRVLGVNILGNFLSGKDSNTKYVALNTLSRVVPQEPRAVKKHRKFITKCLLDTDASIKVRSVELIFAILDETNVQELTNELISFLEISTEDDKDVVNYVVEHIMVVLESERYGEERWRLDMAIKVLELVGEYASYEKVNEVMIMINNARSIELKASLVLKILSTTIDAPADSKVSVENSGWKLVAIWCLGEYADLILGSSGLTEVKLTAWLANMNRMCYDEPRVTSFILSAALKLSCKIQSKSQIEDLRLLIAGHSKDTNLLLQTKSTQYGILFNQPTKSKKAILDAMPFFAKNVVEETASSAETRQPVKSPQAAKETNLLLDLFDTDPVPAAIPGGLGGQKPPLNSNGQKAAPHVPTDHEHVLQAADKIYDCNNLSVYGKVVFCAHQKAVIELNIQSKQKKIINLHTMAAVAKLQQLSMGTLSSGVIDPSGIAKQQLELTGSGKLKLRVKLSYTVDGAEVSEQFDHRFAESL